MKRLRTLLCAVTLSLLAACGQQNAPEPTALNIEMSVRVEPELLAVGETTLIVTLQDGSGSVIEGATLQVHGDMDHKGMTPIDREVSAGLNGEYRVPFVWTMGGGWVVTITALLPENGGAITKTFDFFVEAVSGESIINRNVSTAEMVVHIGYEPDEDPAIVGDAAVTITLTDEDSHPVTDAVVEVIGDMAHHGMMPIRGTGEYAGDARYKVPLRWTMAGDWIVTVTVTLADGRRIEQTFEQQVVVP
jgi:hypothetical protein